MRRSLYQLALPALLGACLAGCATDERPGFSTRPLAPDQVLTTTATVRFANIEGGCWTLRTQEGVYKPLSLPVEYQIDGLPVRVTLTDAPDMADVCMIGPLVHVDSITGILMAGK